MPRLETVNPETATGKTKELLDKVQTKMGRTPNLTKALANSPAALEAYLGLSGALSKGALSAKLQEQIALAVSETNGCGYCLAAHSAVGKMLGLSEEEVLDSRRGESSEGKADAALRFAKQVVEKQGWVSDEDIARVRSAGHGDEEITEIVAHVVRNIFTNYFNHVAETEVDFPAAPALAAR